MQIITTRQALSDQVAACKQKQKTIGLVPTMGALHEGHASLVRKSVSGNNVTFVSVFVNPTQFNNKEDLEKYPRNLERDADLLASLGVDYVFAPTPEEMYTPEEMNTVFNFDFGGLDSVMEGKMRPGHFNGVVQVVSKLFRLVQPDRAYFGEKDYQQLAVIRRMVDIMHFNVQIVGCPIVREASGLALSSRNERLSAEEKQTAVNISHILFESRQLTQSQTVAQVESWVIEQINRVPGLTVEYYQIVDQTTLQPAPDFSHAIGCVTVYCGPVRLIDNVKY
ncbi:MAG: pantoate--beta-alanine ligase [Paludibacteraceae bacterium]|nr:pantoate--beta-alanine ligase [Paludibacteraceae bacterium]MBQ9706135.1 pantoate--beta-alanine ligase [Paludibacteraceae bacterium]